LPEVIGQWVNDILLWVGFGTLVGLAAKAIMPGKDPGGALTTLIMGIAGSVIGCGTLMFFWNGLRVSPISPLGFVVATGGAFLLLFFYRLLAGRYFKEGTDTLFRRHTPHRHHRQVNVLREDCAGHGY